MRKEFSYLLRSIFVVLLLGGSMSAWAQDGDDDGTTAPTFTTDLRSEYFCTADEGVELIVDVDDPDAELKWYKSSDETIDIANDTEIDINEEEWCTSLDFVYKPTDDIYVYCVATVGEGEDAKFTISTVAKVNVLEELTSWDDLFTMSEGKDYYEIANSHDWNAFLYGYDNSLDGASFKLTDNITTTTAPSSQIYLDDYTFDFNGKKIQYTVPCPNSDHSALFFNNDEPDYVDDNNVIYTYTIGSKDDLDNFVGYFISDTYPKSVTFKLLDDIECTSTISTSNVTSFNFNNHEIIYTTTCPSSHTPLFADETVDAKGVKYIYKIISNDEWINFGSLCKDITDADKDMPSNVKFELNTDVTASSIPTTPYPVTSDNFDFGTNPSTNKPYTISYESSSIESLGAIFDNTDLQAKVIYKYYIKSSDDWSNFVENYKAISEAGGSPLYTLNNNLEFDSNATFDQIDETITPDNFHVNGYCITYGPYTSLPTDGEGNICPSTPVFQDSKLQKSCVKYYYKVGNDEFEDAVKWSDFVTFVNSSNCSASDNFTVVDDISIDLKSAPTQSLIPSTITTSNFQISSGKSLKVTVHTYDGLSFNNTIKFPTNPIPVFADEELDKYYSIYVYRIDNAQQMLAFVKAKFLQKSTKTNIYIVGEFVIKQNETSENRKYGDTKYHTTSGTKYDIHEKLFDYPLDVSCHVKIVGDDYGNSENSMGQIAAVTIILPYDGTPHVYVEGPYDPLFETYPELGAVNYNWQTGVQESEEEDIDPTTGTLVQQLLNSFYQGVVFKSSKRGGSYSYSTIENLAGDGKTEATAYKIATYDMLNTLVNYVNTNGTETSGMYIKLISDINAQGGERLTGVKGEKFIESPEENVQFSAAFKGHFDGNGFSLGGFTKPLFSTLDGATVENLGIVDCYMESTPALAESATGSTVTNCYVSGVSNGLVATDGNTVSSYYAWNTKENTITPSGFTSGTKDASGTHDILSDNCYTLGDKKSDCTLFIPTDNTFYTYTTSNTDLAELTKYYYGDNADEYASEDFIKWSEMSLTDDCVENPSKSNVSLLYNVILSDGCKITATHSNKKEYFLDVKSLSNLYYWYLVDKENLTLPTETAENLRIKNIYYSRGTGAYDGFNTVYLPFPWNYDTDLVNQSDNTKQISGATAYILADMTNGVTGDYKDYSSASSLQFITPESSDNFSKISCALPTLLSVPQSGWAIKKHADNGWFYYSTHFAGSSLSSENILSKYEGITGEGDPIHNGRSFMDIERLQKEYIISDMESVQLTTGRALHVGTFTTLDTETFGNGTLSDIQGKTLSAYKLNSAGTGFASVLASSTVLPFRTFFAIAPGSGSGSGAKQFYGFSFVIVNPQNKVCDVNGDDKIDIQDVNNVIGAICGENSTVGYDVNGDGNVDINDVNTVISTICGE